MVGCSLDMQVFLDLLNTHLAPDNALEELLRIVFKIIVIIYYVNFIHHTMKFVITSMKYIS
jgi:hypothetical protein